MTVVTRFAPSPTGYLHIGGARTALFNWLFARHHGGEFCLRVEDTDKERNDPEAITAIYDGLSWLGLNHDRDVVMQSENAGFHYRMAHALVERGAAYYDFTTPEELDALKVNWAKGNKSPFRYWDNPWRDVVSKPTTEKYVIRLKAPREGSTVIEDVVQGRVEVQNHTLDDFILLRSDGSPTYMLAVVCDDHDMEVTHVIRGDDHLTNAFRQVHIYRGMGWAEPVYAHIPLILNQDGKKLSKRNGDVGVESFREQGVLPEAVFNYLLRMGWGHGDHEVVTRDEAIKLFGLDGVGRAPARLDDDRLLHLSGAYIKDCPDDLIEAALDSNVLDTTHPLVTPMIPLLKIRSKTMIELQNYLLMVLERPVERFDDPSGVVEAFYREIAQEASFDAETIRSVVERVAEATGIKLRKAVEPLRLTIFGAKVSPPLFEVMPILGREECMKRIAFNLTTTEDA